MTDEALTPALRATLSQLTERRFVMLLAGIRLGGTFTTADLRDVVEDQQGSLMRDLRALELARLVIGDPPVDQDRRGQRVVYTIAPNVRTVFAELAELVEAAFVSSPSSSS